MSTETRLSHFYHSWHSPKFQWYIDDIYYSEIFSQTHKQLEFFLDVAVM